MANKQSPRCRCEVRRDHAAVVDWKSTLQQSLKENHVIFGIRDYAQWGDIDVYVLLEATVRHDHEVALLYVFHASIIICCMGDWVASGWAIAAPLNSQVNRSACPAWRESALL